MCSKHVEEYNKLIIKQEFVHLVGEMHGQQNIYKSYHIKTCKVQNVSTP